MKRISHGIAIKHGRKVLSPSVLVEMLKEGINSILWLLAK
jgi:hypothetical protein